MDDLDRQLLLFLRNGIPLQKRPFEGIAARLGIDSADVLLTISRLKLKKVIRQITAVLEGRELGYVQTLAAMSVPAEKLEAAVSWMNTHPGVVQCTGREDEFNLWFTLALPAGTVKKQVRRLHEVAGANKTILLPVLKRFKGESGMSSPNALHPSPPNGLVGGPRQKHSRATKSVDSRLKSCGNDTGVSWSAQEMALLRRIQEDFPLDDEPFRKLAVELRISEAELFSVLEMWSRKGYLKKIAAVLPAGSRAGDSMALALLEVPEERQDEVASRVAAFEEVVDCVKRPAYPEFPYALHILIRAEDREYAELILGKISSTVGSWPHRLLWGAREYKKIRVKYYSRGLEDWESRGEVGVISQKE